MYDHEERIRASKVLGFRDDDGVVIKYENRTREALIDTLRSQAKTRVDDNIANKAFENAMRERLKAAHKAKSLANRRADVAERALRDLLDQFKEVLSKDK